LDLKGRRLNKTAGNRKMKSSRHVLLTENYFSIQATKNKVSGAYRKYARRWRDEERCMQDFGAEILENEAC
jgi:hypothetical protein